MFGLIGPVLADDTGRLLLTSLTTSNINAAVAAWITDSANAAATYGNILEWDTSAVTSLYETFYKASTFNENIGSWDTVAVTSLYCTFREASAFNQDLGGWDISAVSTLQATFRESAFNQDIGMWNTGAVTSLASTFYAATAFDQNISEWDTAAVNTLSHTFVDAHVFNQDIGGWDTSAVSTLYATFARAYEFNQDIGAWDTSLATTLRATFSGATAFNQDIGGWDTSAVTTLHVTFAKAHGFNQIIGAWDTRVVTTFEYTFYYASAFNQDIVAWDTGAVTSLYGTFHLASDFNQDISGWDTSVVTNFQGMFAYTDAFNQYIGSWDISAVTSLRDMFHTTPAFNQDISGWDISAVTTLYATFYKASAFNQDIGRWDTRAVTSLSDTISHAFAFNQDIGGWVISAVTTLHATFYKASAFNQDISGWDTSAVATLYKTFSIANVFNQDISGWDISAVTSLIYTFYDASAFNRALCWDTTGITLTSGMFSGSSGAADTFAAKCACTAGEFYNGTACEPCPSGQDSNGKTESCYILPTTAPTLAPMPAPTPPPPTSLPSSFPSTPPTPAPTLAPLPEPSAQPTPAPTLVPSLPPSALPTQAPMLVPSTLPSMLPTPVPTNSTAPSLVPFTLPTPAPTLVPSLLPSTLPDLATSFLVTGSISILCVAIAILSCRTAYRKLKVTHDNGGSNKEHSNDTTEAASVASEAALLAQLQATSDGDLNNVDSMKVSQHEEFMDEEAAHSLKKERFDSTAVSELETMKQKHAEEIARFKLSSESRMKMRQRKIIRLEQEAAKAADLALKLESTAKELAVVSQDKEVLQTKVAELSRKVGISQAGDAVSEDSDFQLPKPSPHNRGASTAIPNELLKGLLGDSAALENKKGVATSDDDPRARVMRAGESVGGAGNVRVAVRVRPPNERELAGEGNGVCVDVVPADGIVKVGSDKAFTFDVAFSMEATQAQVFDKLGVDLVGWVLGGYNASVFAYGQTSSGKTHSMMGVRNSEVLRGLIPRVIALLWECVQAFVNENSKHDCVLKASYLEIYNEEIRDLLGNCEKLELRNDPKQGIFASGLTMVPLQNGEVAMECIERGAQLRSVAATKFNSESSRSHAVFEIHISKTYPTDSGDMVSTSRLSLTDLAGSERSSKVGTSGTSLQEGNNINKSLSTLGRCIAVLVDISQGKKGLAPFRDSVLTLYLRDALAGNVLTTMLANVSPVSSNMEETLSTLRFAASAKRIKTKVTKNEDLQQKRIRELTEELEAVKKELAVQVRQAEGAKKLVLHLNGEMPAAPSEDEDEDVESVAEAGMASAASIIRSAIADRRGSVRDAPLFDTYSDEVSGAASRLADSDEVPRTAVSSTDSVAKISPSAAASPSVGCPQSCFGRKAGRPQRDALMLPTQVKRRKGK